MFYHNILKNQPNWIHILAIAFIYFIAGEISFSVVHEHSIVTIAIFAAEGIALAAAIIYGKHILSGIFLGQFLLGFKSMAILPALGIATVNTIEASIAIFLFYRFNLNRTLPETKDVFGLIVLIIFILQPFSALFGNLILLGFSITTWDEFPSSLFAWWFGNSMGQLLFTPMLLLFYAHFQKKEILEFLSIGLFFGFISYLFQVLIPIQNVSLLLSVSLPLILYLSSVRGLHHATFAIAVIATTTLYLTHIGIGVFIRDTTVNSIINLNFYFLSQILLVLIIGTLFNEKRDRATQLESLIEKAVEKNQKQELMLSQQARLAQMGEAINMIAHQWRQPLNNINALIIIMDMKMSKQQNSDKLSLDKEFNKLESITAYMSHTIDDFRDFFKPAKEKVQFNIEKTIKDSIKLVEPVLYYNSIVIHENYKDTPLLLGYPNELGQVIINIINNAKDALLENNKKSEKHIIIDLYQEDKKIILTIKDNAGGIALDIINHLFDPYFSTKSKKGGTGLGLYISKMIIEEHMNGEISVKNSDDGAIFKIEFKKKSTND